MTDLQHFAETREYFLSFNLSELKTKRGKNYLKLIELRGKRKTYLNQQDIERLQQLIIWIDMAIEQKV